MSYIILLFLFLNISHVQAMHNHDMAEKMEVLSSKDLIDSANCKDVIELELYGMVCDFCARSVEKILNKREEVSAFNVDLDEAIVSVVFHKEQDIADAELAKIIADAGYNLVNIKRGCDE